MDKLLAFAAVHPIITAMAICYLLTFVAVRQAKPYLEYLHGVIDTHLPEDLEKRWFLRLAVLVCGLIVSLVVTSGLIVFDCCALTWLQVAYIAISVGILAPLVYDAIMGGLGVLESWGILPRKVRISIEKAVDPSKEHRKRPREDQRE